MNFNEIKSFNVGDRVFCPLGGEEGIIINYCFLEGYKFPHRYKVLWDKKIRKHWYSKPVDNTTWEMQEEIGIIVLDKEKIKGKLC